MKTIIKDILWYLLNKLDPISYKRIEIKDNGINISFKKNFLKIDKFEQISLNLTYWIKINKKNKETTLNEIELYKDYKFIK